MSKKQKELSKRESDAVSRLMRDPYFRSMNLPQQLKFTKFIRDQLEEQARQIEVSGYEKGMVDTIACVVQVLIDGYWQKTGAKRLPPFLTDVVSLMDSQLHEAMTWDEMVEYVHERTGLNMDTDWMGEDARPTPKKLFTRVGE